MKGNLGAELIFVALERAPEHDGEHLGLLVAHANDGDWLTGRALCERGSSGQREERIERAEHDGGAVEVDIRDVIHRGGTGMSEKRVLVASTAGMSRETITARTPEPVTTASATTPGLVVEKSEPLTVGAKPRP